MVTTQGMTPGIDPTTKKFLDDDIVAALALDPRLTQGGGQLPVDSFGIPITRNGMRVSTAQHIDLREHFNVAAPPTDFGPAIKAAVVEANKTAAQGHIQPVYIPVGVWKVFTTQVITDLSVVLVGPGMIDVQAEAGLFNITQAQGDGLPGTVSVVRSATEASYLSANYTPDSVFTPASPESILGLKNGDIVYLDSDTYYTPTFVSINASHTYKGQWFPIYGVGLSVSMTPGKGGIPADSFVVGESSGARARVRGNRRLATQSGTEVSLNFTEVAHKDTGAPAVFQNGEQLTTIVNGVSTVGAATITAPEYIVSSVRLLDKHETGAQIHKILNPDMIVDIDVKHTATGDTEAVIGSANRKIAIQLNGVIHARVNAYTKNAWTRAVRFQGCFAPVFTGYCVQLPNDANTNEQAYGYFVEAYGSTEFGDFSFIARDCRHPFTDNTTATTGRITNTNNYSRTGVPKWNTVHDSKVIGNVAAGFDTHGGSWETTFRDCHVIGSMGGRPTTGSIGFQVRGANAKLIDCTATGVGVGFRLASNTFNYDWDYQTELTACKATDYSVVGFQIGAASLESLTPSHMASVVLRGCVAEGDGELQSVTGNSPVGYLLVSGQDIQVHQCTSQRFGGNPVLISNLAPAGALGRVVVINHVFDYLKATTTLSPITITGVPTLPVILDRLTALTADVSAAAPPSFWVQVVDVTTGQVQLRVGEFSAPYRSNNVTMLSLFGTTTAANVEVVGIRRQGREVYGEAVRTVDALAAGASVVKTIPALGAAPSDVATANYTAELPEGVIQEAPRVMADQVTVRFTNIRAETSAASLPGTLSTIVTKRGAVV